MRVYLAGPMTGYEHYNFAGFTKGAEFLRSLGHEVVTPFDTNSRVWMRRYCVPFDPMYDVCDYGDDLLPEMIAEDIKELSRSDAIALLPGWLRSKGAKAELLMAQLMGKKVLDAETGQEILKDDAEASVIIITNKPPAPQVIGGPAGPRFDARFQAFFNEAIRDG